jgi:hypothetical protein
MRGQWKIHHKVYCGNSWYPRISFVIYFSCLNAWATIVLDFAENWNKYFEVYIGWTTTGKTSVAVRGARTAKGRNTRQRLCRAPTLGKVPTATSRTATQSLPCAVPYTHGKGLWCALLTLPCALPLCRAWRRCRAPTPLPWVNPLPCAMPFCRVSWRCRAGFVAVRQRWRFAVCPGASSHGKGRGQHTNQLPGCTGARHVGALPCVCARQSDQMVLWFTHTYDLTKAKGTH